MSAYEARIYAPNDVDTIRLVEVDLHDAVRADTGPIDPLPGLEIIADHGDDYATVTLDMSGVHRLILALQRYERDINSRQAGAR